MNERELLFLVCFSCVFIMFLLCFRGVFIVIFRVFIVFLLCFNCLILVFYSVFILFFMILYCSIVVCQWLTALSWGTLIRVGGSSHTRVADSELHSEGPCIR